MKKHEPIPQLITELLHSWNSHDVERLALLFDAQYEGLDVAQAKPQHGQKDAQQSIMRYLAAFPDIQFKLEDTIIEGDRVVLIWTAHGTHLGVFMHIPPTKRPISVRGVSILTVKDDKIRQGYYLWDVAGLLRSMGLLPEL